MTQKELAEQWKQGVQIMYRNQTKEVRIGDVVIGGDHPIAIQSMTNTRTEDVEATVEQPSMDSLTNRDIGYLPGVLT